MELEDIILTQIIMATTTPTPIITIPITQIRMAIITIPIVSDMGDGWNTGALATGDRSDLLEGAVVWARGAVTKVRPQSSFI